MNKCIKRKPFTQYLFDQKDEAEKAARIMHGIVKARSGRLTLISHQMKGKPDPNYKTIQRFLKQVDVKPALLRLFQEEAEFVIGDQLWKHPAINQLLAKLLLEVVSLTILFLPTNQVDLTRICQLLRLWR